MSAPPSLPRYLPSHGASPGATAWLCAGVPVSGAALLPAAFGYAPFRSAAWAGWRWVTLTRQHVHSDRWTERDSSRAAGFRGSQCTPALGFTARLRWLCRHSTALAGVFRVIAGLRPPLELPKPPVQCLCRCSLHLNPSLSTVLSCGC